MGKNSRLYGGKLTCLKCFGDLVLDEGGEFTVRGTVDFDKKEIEKKLIK